MVVVVVEGVKGKQQSNVGKITHIYKYTYNFYWTATITKTTRLYHNGWFCFVRFSSFFLSFFSVVVKTHAHILHLLRLMSIYTDLMLMKRAVNSACELVCVCRAFSCFLSLFCLMLVNFEHIKVSRSFLPQWFWFARFESCWIVNCNDESKWKFRMKIVCHHHLRARMHTSYMHIDCTFPSFFVALLCTVPLQHSCFSLGVFVSAPNRPTQITPFDLAPSLSTTKNVRSILV